jgi:cytochrome c oxidase subunit II
VTGTALALGALAALGPQDILAPAGPQAQRISVLMWFLFATGGAVYLFVMAALALAVLRGRRRRLEEGLMPETREGPLPEPDPRGEAVRRRAVTAAVAVTTVILLAVTAGSYLTGKAIATVPADPLTVKVIGHQWWWDFEYQDPIPNRHVRSANELYIPVGRPVHFQITSGDVIHSFWVPNLHGKRDAIPGQVSVEWFQADAPGEWRGQCAEFCGFQHAHMAFTVTALPEAEFDAWYERQLQPAPAPATPEQRLGQTVFLSSPCAVCHTIGGTTAGGRVGPELTHVGSRRSLAAGTLENTKGHMMGWVSNSQEIKPGNRMPPNPMSPEELHAVIDYLQSLK